MQILDESGTLRHRASMLIWADIVALTVSDRFQWEFACDETANYAKELGKPLITVILGINYEPSGSVGLICKAYGSHTYWRLGDDLGCKFVQNQIDLLCSAANKFAYVKLPTTVNNKTEEAIKCGNNHKSNTTDQSILIFVSATPQDSSIVDTIKEAKQLKTVGPVDQKAILFHHDSVKLTVDYEAIDCADQSIIDCQVFLAVLSDTYSESARHERQFELARSCQKTIIPVKGGRYKPQGWLALAICGKLFYQLDTNEDSLNLPFKNFPDSTPMTEFRRGVNEALQRASTDQNWQICMQTSLQKQIDVCRQKLNKWPPVESVSDRISTKIPNKNELLPQSKLELPLSYTFYTVARLNLAEFALNTVKYDAYGVPINITHDCMISYSWKSQDLVHDCIMQFEVYNVHFWLDLWGNLRGNIYQSIANAIENSNSIVVFFTESYQKSINCNLELKYAVALKKPMMFIVGNMNFEVKEWIKPLLAEHLTIEIGSKEDLGTYIDGYPKILILTQAIQKPNKWASSQPPNLRTDVSDELYQLQLLLEISLNAVAIQEGQQRYQICTRCDAKFDNNSKRGCGQHTAYYLGGTLIEGHWVCCNQTDKNGAGCKPTEHTTEQRIWNEMDGYAGCFHWAPA